MRKAIVGVLFLVAAQVPLIPREVLFGNPKYAAVRVSPDGRYLSWLAPDEGVLNIWVAPREAPEEARAVTRDRERGIQIYAWTYLPDTLLYIQDEKGDENWRIYTVNVKTGEIKNLTPLERVQARIYGLSYRHPDKALIGLNDRDPRLHDLYLLNLKDGSRERILENPGFVHFTVDLDLQVRLAMAATPTGAVQILQATPEGWKPFLTVPPEDNITTAPLTISADGKTAYFIDSTGRDLAALVARNLETGEARLLWEPEKADLGDVLVHPRTHEPLAVAAEYERKRWYALKPEVSQHLERLQALEEGNLSIVSRSLDERFWVAALDAPEYGVKYYLYDAETGEAQFLFSNRPALQEYTLARTQPLVLKARDGLPLVAYLTLPPWSDPDGDGRPDAPLPLVLVVHGGPWARDSWGYRPEHQRLANRGYAVLSVNFRGSTGFGKRFINAANREWGGKMQEDLEDAVQWAIQEGIADPERIAIMGASYGGYATLMGVVKTPELYACGVSAVGPSNLVTFMETIPPYWMPFLPILYQRVGDPRTEEGKKFLLERSPITYVDRLRVPLLIAHGQNDPRVKRSESDQIVDALKKRNLPVIYVVYPDEGHGFVRPENRLAFSAIAEIFLAECLGGRVEPLHGELEKSSAQILEGEQILQKWTTAQ